MRRSSFTALAALTAALALTATAGPAAAAAPDERAAAKAFADAARAFTLDVRAAMPDVRASLEAAAADQRHCGVLDGYVERALRGSPLTRRQFRVLLLMLNAPILSAHVPLLPAHERLLAALDATPTADPALRSARAIWRSQTNGLRLSATYPPDMCARLAAWYRGGARGIPVPEVDLRGEDDPDVMTTRPTDVAGRERRLERAVRRLRQLGQGPRRAARLGGDVALAPVLRLIGEFFEPVLE